MDAFPAFLPLAGRTVVIAGSGDMAEAKARLFDGSPATVKRLTAPEAYLPAAYAGAVAAFVASDDPLFIQQAVAAARSAHVLLNVVDHTDLCDFYTPAVVDRGEVVAAIGTAGASPMLAALLRNDIETHVPEGAGRVAALLRRRRDAVRAAYPELHERRAFLRAALSGSAAQAAMAGDMEAAERLLTEALETRAEVRGAVRFVAGRGPADLLTLRAVRALGAADVLAPDADADAEVLRMARRDAVWLEGEDVAIDRLIDLARNGRQIVRVVTGPLSPEDGRRLAASGVAVDVLLAAPET